MKFSIKVFVSKCDHIRRKLRIWSHLLKKSLMENINFCAVSLPVEYNLFLASRNMIWSSDLGIAVEAKALHHVLHNYNMEIK